MGSLIFSAMKNNLKTRPHCSIFIQSIYYFIEINADRSRSGWGGQVDIGTREERPLGWIRQRVRDGDAGGQHLKISTLMLCKEIKRSTKQCGERIVGGKICEVG